MNFNFNYISNKFVFWNLKKISHGYLELIDTKGSHHYFGDIKSPLKAKVKIKGEKTRKMGSLTFKIK